MLKPPPIKATRRELYALQAVFKGEANPQQQKTFVKWLVWKACRTHADIEPSEISDFLLGRRSIGVACLISLEKDPNKEPDTNG